MQRAVRHSFSLGHIIATVSWGPSEDIWGFSAQDATDETSYRHQSGSHKALGSSNNLQGWVHLQLSRNTAEFLLRAEYREDAQKEIGN